MEHRKILCVAPHLDGGGSQRVLINIVNYLGNENLDLLVINKEGKLLKQINDDIKIISTKASRARNAILEIKNILDKNNYGIIFTMKGYLGIIVLISKMLSKNKPRIIYREVVHVTTILKKKGRLKFINKLLYKIMYKKVYKIIAPSLEIKKDLIENFNIVPNKIKVINNPVDTKKINKSIKEQIDHHWFQLQREIPVLVGMGRLTEQKGFKFLIEAIELLKMRNIKVRLAILGEGEKEKELKLRVKKKKLNDRIQFLGFKENPFIYIANADLFILSSLFEGFPNALLEAMACETPVISTSCPSGPSEIINNNKNGILVPYKNSERLADEIIQLINNPNFASALAKRGGVTVRQRFALDIIMRKYEKLFMNI
ncbi:MAG: glycosyltransferase [Candidatus Woesearchaeota archaeon]